uniref:Uncharacterized protein n=1 Tax=Trichogramma kaykai TaxID=54128 RepID=A0ABD2VV50_9HYME
MTLRDPSFCQVATFFNNIIFLFFRKRRRLFTFFGCSRNVTSRARGRIQEKPEATKEEKSNVAQAREYNGERARSK